ncbi:MAG TPA: twin transmembrane helix small protein [Gammaproteobacteria bacterium]
MRLIGLLLYVAILVSLASALLAMFRPRPGDPKRMARALTARVALSLLLFALLFVAWFFGWIEPHGIGG